MEHFCKLLEQCFFLEERKKEKKLFPRRQIDWNYSLLTGFLRPAQGAEVCRDVMGPLVEAEEASGAAEESAGDAAGLAAWRLER